MIGSVMRVTTVPAKLDINTVAAKLETRYVPAQLDIQTTQPRVDIKTRNIRCDIDSSACFAEEGQKSIAMLLADRANEAAASVDEFTHNLAVVGDMLLRAMPGENVFPEIAKSELKGELPDTVLSFIPSQRPRITWYDNAISVEGRPGKTETSWTTQTMAHGQLTQKGSVTITQVQKPEIHFEFVGDTNTLHLLDTMA